MAAVIPLSTTPTAPVDYALAYAGLGWHVFPAFSIRDGKCACGNECKNPGKHPIGWLVRKGQDDATTDPTKIRSWWTSAPDANVAVMLKPSGLVAIDIDPRNGGWDSIDDLEAQHGGLVSDVLQLTGGGGEHRLFALASDSNLALPGTLGPGVDVKRNGYIIAEPSSHVSGKIYEWEASSNPLDGVVAPPLPDWLRGTFTQNHAASLPPVPTLPLTASLRIDLEQALLHIPAHDRDTWYRVGMALHSTGAGSEAFSLWDAWSRSCPEKYDAVDQMRVWRSFRNKGLSGVTKATIFSMAQKNGWINACAPVATAPAPAIVASRPTPQNHEPGTIPEVLFTIPGALGELVAHNIASAIKPQRVLAVSAALTFGATLMARMYETKTGLRSNLYLLGIAPTAYGKEHARNINKDVLVACAMKDRIGGEEIKSGAALLARAQIEPCSLFQLDEFGLTLQSVMSPNANGYQAEIMHNFMKLYSSSSSIMAGPEYADQRMRPRVDIEYPNVSLYGTSTAETVWPALRSNHVLSGFLNRFIFTHSECTSMPADETPTKHRADIPEPFLLWCKSIISTDGLSARGNMVGVSPSSPFTVQETAAASTLLKEFSLYCNEQMNALKGSGIDGLWGRANAYALKIAMIVSGSLDPKPPVITEHAAEWAITFVRYWTQRLVDDVRLRVVDDEFSAKCDSVLRILDKGGAAGCSLREISQRWKGWRGLRPREQQEVLESIVRNGDAVQVQRKGARGPACVAFVSRRFAPEATVSDVDE